MRRRIVAELSSLREAHDQLDEQARELTRSNAELEQFAYVASHDLQEPLRKVASFCQLIEQRYEDQLDERGKQYIAFAVDGAKRMQQLINDLLAFSRVGRSRGRAAGRRPATTCCARRSRASAQAIEESGAQIEAGPLPRGARRAGAAGGRLPEPDRQRAEVPRRRRPAAGRGRGRAATATSGSSRVADDGIGIEPEYAERIFMIFQRLHPKDAYAGTGIGLAMCRKIVEYHGGRIWLDTDAPDGRTTFRFTLPAIDEESVPT